MKYGIRSALAFLKSVMGTERDERVVEPPNVPYRSKTSDRRTGQAQILFAEVFQGENYFGAAIIILPRESPLRNREYNRRGVWRAFWNTKSTILATRYGKSKFLGSANVNGQQTSIDLTSPYFDAVSRHFSAARPTSSNRFWN